VKRCTADIFRGQARWLGIRQTVSRTNAHAVLERPLSLKPLTPRRWEGSQHPAFALAGSQFAQTGSQIVV